MKFGYSTSAGSSLLPFDFYSSSEASLVKTVVLATGALLRPTFLIMDLAASMYDWVEDGVYLSSGSGW